EWICSCRISPSGISPSRIRSSRLCSIRVSLSLLTKNGDELPLIILLMIVVDLNRLFTAVRRDSDDSGGAYWITAPNVGPAGCTCGLLAPLLRLLSLSKAKWLLAAQSTWRC